jgi:hypothetical protein
MASPCWAWAKLATKNNPQMTASSVNFLKRDLQSFRVGDWMRLLTRWDAITGNLNPSYVSARNGFNGARAERRRSVNICQRLLVPESPRAVEASLKVTRDAEICFARLYKKKQTENVMFSATSGHWMGFRSSGELAIGPPVFISQMISNL